MLRIIEKWLDLDGLRAHHSRTTQRTDIPNAHGDFESLANMSDPLSVATGIVGLITAGAKITMTLYNIGSGIQDAPKLTQAAADELTNITVVLQQLQAYVLGKARASVQRLNLITVEHITATLTSCVVTYSELDVVLKSLHADTGLRAWDRGMWYLKRDKVAEIVQRMQNHKATLALMLNILQWYGSHLPSPLELHKRTAAHVLTRCRFTS